MNLDVFKFLHQKYTKEHGPFLNELRDEAKRKKPYQNLKIFHKTPLTLSTMLKIEVLILGGADVTVSCVKSVPPDPVAIQLLKAADIRFQMDPDPSERYDFHLDCCAELIDFPPPNIGAVELTQTGSTKYKEASVSYPIISIDDSRLKFLETLGGTGDGFARSLFQIEAENMVNQSFILFGYGKVGKGISRALKKFTNKITIIDIQPKENITKELSGEIEFLHASEKEEIRQRIKNAYCVVTATGVKNLISDCYQFTKADFKDAILTNMGAEDEYGDNFTTEDVLFEKNPLNFSIGEPTAFKYLDPVFYAHNIGIDLILAGQMKIGYNPFPDSLASKILKKWEMLHREALVSTSC